MMPFSKQVRTRRNTILVLLAIIGLVASTTFISSSVTASAVVYAETADYYELKLGDKTVTVNIGGMARMAQSLTASRSIMPRKDMMFCMPHVILR